MKEIFLIGGDTRSDWAAKHLESSGCAVRTFGVPQLPDTPLPQTLSRVVLPFPSFQGERVRGNAGVPVAEILSRLHAESIVFGGKLSGWREAFEARGARVFDCYGTEPLTTANAVPTAEGAIALAIAHSPDMLHGAHCLIIGFGRIGKVLSQKLRALSAHVTVSARSAGDLALAQALGLRSDRTGVYLHGLGQYDFVFNTVPAPVLSREQLSQLPHGCVLLELASAPFGFSAADCAALGLSYQSASALPTRFAPKAAGTLYAQCILDLFKREELP